MKMNMTPAERLEAVADNLVGWRGDVCFLAEVIIQETGNRRYFWTPSGKLLGFHTGSDNRKDRRKEPSLSAAEAAALAVAAAVDPQICEA